MDIELFNYVKKYRTDLVSISRNLDGSYTIGQLDGEDLPNLQEIVDLADFFVEGYLACRLNERVLGALAKGQALIQEFITENLTLGITQAGKTKQVRQAMAEVTSCLMTGSLYDAIDELRLIPAEAKDDTFITDVRILNYINKIEEYLGIPLSTEV